MNLLGPFKVSSGAARLVPSAVVTAVALTVLVTACGGGGGRGSNSTSTNATQARVAQWLYEALLKTPYPDSQLPSGFSSAEVGGSSPSSGARSLHVIGEVEVVVNGPDLDDALLYVVFPDTADAEADLARRKPRGGNMHIVPGGVPGSSLPGHMWAGSITGRNGRGR